MNGLILKQCITINIEYDYEIFIQYFIFIIISLNLFYIVYFCYRIHFQYILLHVEIIVSFFDFRR